MAVGAHRSGENGTGERLRARKLLVVAGAVVAVSALAVGTVTLVTHRGASPDRTEASAGGARAGGVSSGGAKAALGTGQQSASAGHAAPAAPAPTTTTAPPPLAVESIRPRPSAKGVTAGAAITVTFSEPLATSSPKPTLTPRIAGQWTVEGTQMVFHPTGGYIPDTKVTVTVPRATSGRDGQDTVQLAASYKSSFTVGQGSVLRLQELLADLHYLPFIFVRGDAATTAAATTTARPNSTPAVVGDLSEEPKVADAVPTSVIPGTFEWAYPNIPPALAAVWAAGKPNVVTQGAVMAFESTHDMAVDGVAGPQVWTALVKAVAARQMDPYPYNYLEVNEVGTEYLRVWSDGKIVYTSLANTGVPGAATAQGTFPVYSRFENTMMSGTDVDGTKYDVPVSWVAYFNGGDAVHGYARPGYGYPQSNGCVELPIPNAETIFTSSEGWDAYGTLVNVSDYG